jgi:hypothetical protein
MDGFYKNTAVAKLAAQIFVQNRPQGKTLIESLVDLVVNYFEVILGF